MFVQNILRHPSFCHNKTASRTSCGMRCWPEGVGSPISIPTTSTNQSSSLELALQTVSILGRSLETAYDVQAPWSRSQATRH